MAVRNRARLSAACSFNINVDSVYPVPESGLAPIMKERIFENAFSSKSQQEFLVDKKTHSLVMSRLNRLAKPKNLIGGNIGNMADELSLSGLFNCVIYSSCSGVSPSLFSSPDPMFLAGKGSPACFSALKPTGPANPHLILQTESRRLIVTPKQRFVFSRFPRPPANQAYDWLVVSGFHLLSEHQARSFLQYLKGFKAGKTYLELAHSNDPGLVDFLVEEAIPCFDYVGMSIEELEAFGRKRVSSNSNSYIVHSKGDLECRPKALMPILKKADAHCRRLFSRKGISVGLGDRFSARVICGLSRP